MKFLSMVVMLMVSCSACKTKAAAVAKQKCAEPPQEYAGLELLDCQTDLKSGKEGCSYGVVMKDATGQVWHGALLMIRNTCLAPFFPVYLEMRPDPAPSREADNSDKKGSDDSL